ncbi:hypothetical protein NBRC10512_003818 [Rhodotorula toruloides]|uniref:Lysophospholipase n=2 Tax=Rhodotorula toruloides TaxID=5286 RepID=A0A061B6L6_RHOTO|nr:phospholipase A2 [Rhodotorula toruloides NP11]EMS20042.1 phospholipase A2 [Rhodotorula toruloides NP11]CDR45551.1 RHTO0S11e01904g1_1 [Rhodotorula toruloides]
MAWRGAHSLYRPPLTTLRPSRGSSRRLLSTPARLSPSTITPAVQGLFLVAGAAVGAGAGSYGTRTFWSRSLRCEEGKRSSSTDARSSRNDDDDSGILDKLKSFSPPSLPSAPSISIPSISLPDIGGTLSTWTESLSSLTTTFSKLQDELSLGPNSTYSRIVQEGKDPSIHPELQWDATVRTGQDLPHTERAFLRNRRDKMRAAFARLMDVPLEEVDVRDLPVVAVAASGGGYRAMLNTAASLQAAKETGIWDTLTYASGVSGSCWALNTLYTLGGGQIDWTLRHLRERVKEPFLAPDTFINLLDFDDLASRTIISAAILKEAIQGGEVSLVDAYGTLVSTRLYVPSEQDDLPPPPRPLTLRTLKTSSQRDILEDGSSPLPIYTTVRHDLPSPEELEKAEKEGGESASETVKKARWTWFETTCYEVGSDKLGAWIPTWALGRLFDGGKSTERVPELGVPVLSGIYASAFCATLFSYFLEVKPLLISLPFFGAIDDFVKKNAHKLDSIHPLPPAELPNFLYSLPGSLPPSVPSSIVKEKTLGFADAGVELNIPYVPLMRRSVDVIIALDASADNHETWFARAAEYAKQYSEKAQSRFAWPEVDVKAIFPGAEEGEMKEKEKSRDDAATKVDQAKAQERVTASKTAHEREGVETKNPEPVPTGSAPQSREAATKGKVDEKGVPVEADDKPMPESQGAKEPPLGKCSIWIGSTSRSQAATCRNDNPTVDDVLARDGIALAYIPLSPDETFPNPLEVFSTWKFDYTEEETDKLIRLAKANFTAGEQQLKTLIKGVWLRKRKQRLGDEAAGRAPQA